MTLRARLFLAFGAFIGLFVLAQWWLVRSLTHDLTKESDFLAMFVGASVAQMLTVDLNCEGDEQECARTLDVTAAMHPADGTQGIQWHGQSTSGERIHKILEERVDRQGHGVEEEHRLVRVIRHRVENDPEQNSAAQPQSGDPSVGGKVHAEEGHVGEGHIEERNIGEGPSDRVVHMKVFEGRSSEPIIERIAAVHGDQDISLRVGRSSGSRVLFVERPDRVAQVPIPSPGKEALERFQNRLWLGSGALTVLGLLLAALISHRVSSPLRRLAAAASDLGDGALGTQVDDQSGDREIRGTLQAFNQMSERLAELESETRRLEAVRHMGELGDVARGLAHTLRNPLNALGLSVEELARGKHDETDQSLADSARRQIQRIDRGIRSFLLLASQGGDSDEVTLDRVDVAELVRDVALEAIQDVAGRVHLDLHIDGDLHAEQEAVEPELRAVVQALVVNALEASPDGGIVDVFLRRAETAENRLLLRVEDQGPGLPPEIRDRLFTPHLSTKPNGSGMGLFLAQRIAGHRYDGRLELIDLEPRGLRAELEFGPRRGIGTTEEGR